MAEFPGLLLAALLIDRIGQRVTLGCMILLCCAFSAPLSIQLREGLSIILLFCARTCVMGGFAVLHVYSPEIYPTSCRNTGVGFANFIGRVGSIVAPLTITALLENHHQKEAVLVMDLALFLAWVACTLFPLETKGREIHWFFRIRCIYHLIGIIVTFLVPSTLSGLYSPSFDDGATACKVVPFICSFISPASSPKFVLEYVYTLSQVVLPYVG